MLSEPYHTMKHKDTHLEQVNQNIKPIFCIYGV